MTTIRTFRFDPVPDKRYAIELGGAALYVRQGSWPGVRIFFDETSEGWEGERSSQVHDGQLFARPFKRAYVQFPSIVGPLALQLEHMDCAALAVAPNAGIPPPTRVRYVARFDGGTIAEAAEIDLVPRTEPSERERGGFDDELYSTVDSYLGGTITARRSSGAGGLEVRLYHVLELPGAGAIEVPVMRWIAAEFPAGGGRWITSLEFGGTRSFAAGLTQGLTPVPKPAWRLTAIAGAATAFDELYANIYTRSLL